MIRSLRTALHAVLRSINLPSVCTLLFTPYLIVTLCLIAFSKMAPLRDETHPKRAHVSREERSMFEPIAIVGMAFKFPQGAEDPETLWEMLAGKQCAATTFPKDRFDIDAFWHPDTKRQNIVG